MSNFYDKPMIERDISSSLIHTRGMDGYKKHFKVPDMSGCLLLCSHHQHHSDWNGILCHVKKDCFYYKKINQKPYFYNNNNNNNINNDKNKIDNNIDEYYQNDNIDLEALWNNFDNIKNNNDANNNNSERDGIIRLSFRKDIRFFGTYSKYGPSTFNIGGRSEDLILEAESPDEMKNWLFTFQRSIAYCMSYDNDNELKIDEDNILFPSFHGRQSSRDDSIIPNKLNISKEFSRDDSIYPLSSSAVTSPSYGFTSDNFSEYSQNRNKLRTASNDSAGSLSPNTYQNHLNIDDDDVFFELDDITNEQTTYDNIIQYGSHSIMGCKGVNQDRYINIDDIGEYINIDELRNKSFYCVADGHAGDETAIYIENNLFDIFIKNIELLKNNPIDNWINSLIEIDEKILTELDTEAGSTLIGAYITSTNIYLANVGDSQAVLYRDNKPIIITEPHTPNLPDEKNRIEDANGWITEEKSYDVGRQLYSSSSSKGPKLIYRLYGDLMVSRALGDSCYKQLISKTFEQLDDVMWPWPENHPQSFTKDSLIPIPEVIVHERNENDQFLILACDGLWDVMEPNHAIDIILDEINNKNNTDLYLISKILVENAANMGSEDDITVIIVDLKNNHF